VPNGAARSSPGIGHTGQQMHEGGSKAALANPMPGGYDLFD
jgi:hypothetical protein